MTETATVIAVFHINRFFTPSEQNLHRIETDISKLCESKYVIGIQNPITYILLTNP